ncbi:MAG: MSMEG_4193 family putative phosphomutase [Candidatus Promineifilaceae bacterium]
MAYILLVRHGQNDWVKKNRLAGWISGVHLNDEGKKQVRELAERLSDLPIKAVYSSPLERCMETAEALAQPHKLDINRLDAVGEVRYGEWEGQKIKKLAKEKAWYAVQHFPSRFRFPDGESFLEVQQRAVDAIESLNNRYKEEMIVVVSHADVIKLVLAYYMGTHLDLFQRIGLSPASVSILALGKNGVVRVLRVNDSGPIKPPPPPEDKKKKDVQKEKVSGNDNDQTNEKK